jgi:cobalt transporter subunit CbtB
MTTMVTEGKGESAMAMTDARTTTGTTAGTAVGTDARVERAVALAPAFATIALGLVVLFCVGFLQVSKVHNGAHDTRHANGFPCH